MPSSPGPRLRASVAPQPPSRYSAPEHAGHAPPRSKPRRPERPKAPAHPLLSLQRAAGNAAVQRWLEPGEGSLDAQAFRAGASPALQEGGEAGAQASTPPAQRWRGPAQLAGDESRKTLVGKETGGIEQSTGKIAKIIEAAVPANGDSASVGFELEVPIGSSGGFVGFRLGGEAERDDDMVKTRLELAVTGGAKVPVAKIKAEVGGYIEAQAPTAAAALQLFSYGLYRRMRESSTVPRGLVNTMWGGGAWEREKSEEWSLAVEKAMWDLGPEPVITEAPYKDMEEKDRQGAFDKAHTEWEARKEQVSETYVETGGLAAVEGGVSVFVADLEASIKGTSGRRITAESLKAAKGGAGKQNVRTGVFTKTQKTLGISTSTVSFGGSISAGPFGMEVEFKREQIGDDSTWSVEGAGTAEVPLGQLVGKGLTNQIATGVTAAAASLRTWTTKSDSEVKGARTAGQGAVIGSDLAGGFGVFNAGTFTPEWESSDFTESSTEAKVGLKLTIGAEWDGTWEDRKTAKKTWSVEVSLVRGAEIAAIPLVGVSLERTSRIFKVERDGDGNWSLA